MPDPDSIKNTDAAESADAPAQTGPRTPAMEIGGRNGLEPTRYGDWEKDGRCIDF